MTNVSSAYPPSQEVGVRVGPSATRGRCVFWGTRRDADGHTPARRHLLVTREQQTIDQKMREGRVR